MWTWVSFLMYVPRSGIAGSCRNSALNFLRNRQTVFHSSRPILPPHQQCLRVQFLCILLSCSPQDMKWRFTVVLMCISPMTSDAEHLSMCFWLFLCLWRSVHLSHLSIWMSLFQSGHARTLVVSYRTHWESVNKTEEPNGKSPAESLAGCRTRM